MSEFTEIMRQARRLCAANGGMCITNSCPLDSGEACRLNINLDGEDFSELERIIMDWAKEHPEPVYPSLEEGWRQLFPDAMCTPCPDNFGLRYSVPNCAYPACADCKSAEVAEKLGIKPIAPEKPPKHDCDTCKFERRKSTDEPCVRCKHCIDCEESILTAPDLWEAQNNGQ